MNGKLHSETGAFSSDDMRAEILNPFVHKLELDNTYDKIKVGEIAAMFINAFRNPTCVVKVLSKMKVQDRKRFRIAQTRICIMKT